MADRNCAQRPVSEWTLYDKLFTVKAYMGVVLVATRVGDAVTAEKYRQCIAEMLPMLNLTEEDLLVGCLGCSAERAAIIMSGFHEWKSLSHVLQSLDIPILAA